MIPRNISKKTLRCDGPSVQSFSLSVPSPVVRATVRIRVCARTHVCARAHVCVCVRACVFLLLRARAPVCVCCVPENLGVGKGKGHDAPEGAGNTEEDGGPDLLYCISHSLVPSHARILLCEIMDQVG